MVVETPILDSRHKKWCGDTLVFFCYLQAILLACDFSTILHFYNSTKQFYNFTILQNNSTILQNDFTILHFFKTILQFYNSTKWFTILQNFYNFTNSTKLIEQCRENCQNGKMKILTNLNNEHVSPCVRFSPNDLKQWLATSTNMPSHFQ